jgi:intracellular multiplication protein IcmT
MVNPPSPNAHWRDSARYPLLFFVDARAVFPVILCLLHIRIWTISVALAATLFFTVLNHYGFTVAVFGRWLRTNLAGRRKIAAPWWL